VPVHVLGTFLQFTLLYNEGGAMGTRLGPSAYYLIMALLVLPFLLAYIYRNRFRPAISLPLAFIAGGAIGNLIDRIRFGQVVDFIDVDFFVIDFLGFHLERFWTFNIADAAISCAIVFLLIQIILLRKTLDPVPALPKDQVENEPRTPHDPRSEQ
jgi:signal peptidase II